MRYFNPASERLIVLMILDIFMCLLSSDVMAEGIPTSVSPKLASAPQPSLKELHSWRASITHLPIPKKGCFKAEYPKIKWQEIPCTKPTTLPYLPVTGPRAETVGNGNDVVAAVSGGHIQEAIGSFDSVTGVQNEYGSSPCSGAIIANSFSLQLNSNFFSTPACTSPCEGWAQFVYSNLQGCGIGGQGFIQYWLLNYGSPSCPSSGGPAGTGWIRYTSGGIHYCYGNSNAVSVPAQVIGNLVNMTVTGQAASGGLDALMFSTGSTVYTTSNNDSVVHLANGWQDAEFNIFGDSSGYEAYVNYGLSSVATLQVRTTVDYNSLSAPTCLATGYTGETNNLSFGTPPSFSTTKGNPAIVFTESSNGTEPSACASAVSIGDTHLMTFDGLYYDFQATGDFVLTDVDSNFIVQTRQVIARATPGWAKNTTLNKAVAMKMGETHIALYTGPTRLVVDGNPYTLPKGEKHVLENGVQISYKDNRYLIVSPNGNSVSALINRNASNTWLNVKVNLGCSVGHANGLLGDPKGNAHELVTSHGTVLKSPVCFDDLYNTYAESWRVRPNEMLLEADPTLKPGIPEKPFFVNDLEPKVAAHAIKTCKKAGITNQALLEACALDTVVLNDDNTPVKAFVKAIVPRAALPRPIFFSSGPQK